MKTLWRASDYQLDLERSSRGNPILSGILVRFNEWNEIDSPLEGHFMERVAPGAFRKTLMERMDRLQVLFQHGRDPQIGQKPLGTIRDMPADEHAQRYEVELFNVSYVDDLLPALERGRYGSSFSARDIKSEWVMRAKKSDHNPDGITEVTREELAMHEFGPVTFPANDGTTAHVRSITDEHVHPGLLELLAAVGVQIPVTRGAAALDQEKPEQAEADEAEVATTSAEDEPQHSAEEIVQTEDTEEVAEPSWQL